MQEEILSVVNRYGFGQGSHNPECALTRHMSTVALLRGLEAEENYSECRTEQRRRVAHLR